MASSYSERSKVKENLAPLAPTGGEGLGLRGTNHAAVSGNSLAAGPMCNEQTVIALLFNCCEHHPLTPNTSPLRKRGEPVRRLVFFVKEAPAYISLARPFSHV